MEASTFVQTILQIMGNASIVSAFLFFLFMTFTPGWKSIKEANGENETV